MKFTVWEKKLADLVFRELLLKSRVCISSITIQYPEDNRVDVMIDSKGLRVVLNYSYKGTNVELVNYKIDLGDTSVSSSCIEAIVVPLSRVHKRFNEVLKTIYEILPYMTGEVKGSVTT